MYSQGRCGLSFVQKPNPDKIRMAAGICFNLMFLLTPFDRKLFPIWLADFVVGEINLTH